MKLNKGIIKDFLKKIDAKTVFISIITSIMFIYFINPLKNVDISSWDNTFSSSVLEGISISKRVNNFYLLYLVQAPLILAVITCLYGILFRINEKYKDVFFKISIILIFPIIIAYLNRFNSQSEVMENNIIINILSFFAVLGLIALIDKEKRLTNGHIAVLYGFYLIRNNYI